MVMRGFEPVTPVIGYQRFDHYFRQWGVACIPGLIYGQGIAQE